MSRAKPKKKNHTYTPISQHKRQGNTLQAPLRQLPLQTTNWERDWLPEHLWIAALAKEFGVDNFHNQYNAFLDCLDNFWDRKDIVAFGLLSDFGLISEDLRQPFLVRHRDVVEQLFLRPMREILMLYPDNPASWLLNMATTHRPIKSREESIHKLSGIVAELLESRGSLATRVRVVPFSRLLVHEKIKFVQGLPILDLLPKYPIGLEEDDQRHVEASVRAMMNIEFGARANLVQNPWSRLFWQSNLDLAQCRPFDVEYSHTNEAARSWVEGVVEAATRNTETCQEYLRLLATRFRPDLYDPTRDEVLIGLFVRITRLYCMLAEEPRFWTRDLGGIALRCLADSVITFTYLVECGSDEDFSKFKEYGEGQQKLLALHLQDNYEGKVSIDGSSADELARRLDMFPEFLNIELKGWTTKNARELAQAVGLDEIYRLIYSPASNDLHGSWFSIKDSNLSYCAEPLHRYHRLPALVHPPVFPETVNVATMTYKAALVAAIANLNYPQMGGSLVEVSIAPESDQ